LATFCHFPSRDEAPTGILIWRIWRVEKQTEKYTTGTQPRYLRRVIRVIAESGAAYTVLVFITFVVSITRSNALYPVSDMVSYFNAQY
jgi:hypothetical protein